MASESKLPWIIFAGLVALIVVPLLLHRAKEARRPTLEEVRIITATCADPVFRTGPRTADAGDEVRIAAAIRIGRGDGAGRWMAPVDRLEIDGEPVEHTADGSWPEDDRVLRVFWFTVEGAYLGGDLTAENADKLLAQRAFLAPEMGRGLMAKTTPEQHNDDQINLGDEIVETGGGTFGLYAKVEIAERADALASEQSAATRGAADAFSRGFPRVSRGASFPEPVSPVLGELFRLPGFEPAAGDGVSWNEVTTGARGATFTELVAGRFVVSSWTFASVALSGGEDMSRDDLHPLGELAIGDDGPQLAGRALRWSGQVRCGDLLVDRGQSIVLLEDDGDGVLGLADRVAHCWRRPPVVTTLEQAIRDDAGALEWMRRGD